VAEPRFRELWEELLRAGVAPRHARRRLGTNQELVRRYASRPELLAWSRRWPSFCFAIMPLLTYLVIGFSTLMAIGELGGPH
jgi:hypothetical protein